MLLQWGFFFLFWIAPAAAASTSVLSPATVTVTASFVSVSKFMALRVYKTIPIKQELDVWFLWTVTWASQSVFFFSLKILKVNKLRLDIYIYILKTSFHFGECKEQPENASCDISTCKCSVEQAVEDEDSLVHFKTVLSRINTNSRKRQDDFRLWQELEPAIDWGAGKKEHPTSKISEVGDMLLV